MKLLSPTQFRAALSCVVSNFPVSQRRAYLFLEQPRSTQRLSPKVTSDAGLTLRDRLRGLASWYPRHGYRCLHALLVAEGFRANHKRVQRLCGDESLRGSAKKRKRERTGKSTIP